MTLLYESNMYPSNHSRLFQHIGYGMPVGMGVNIKTPSGKF